LPTRQNLAFPTCLHDVTNPEQHSVILKKIAREIEVTDCDANKDRGWCSYGADDKSRVIVIAEMSKFVDVPGMGDKHS